MDIAADKAGNLYIASNVQNRVFKVSPGGVLTTFAGNSCGGYTGDTGDGGPATLACLEVPDGVAVDATGNVYIAEILGNRVRKVSNGVITTVAGNGGGWGYSGDGGLAINASFHGPSFMAVDTQGNLYIADGNGVTRKVAGGIITTVAPYAGPMAVDASGALYIATNGMVRKLSGGVATIVAGNGSIGYSGDGGPATSASLDNPGGIALDGAGNIYISTGSDNRIRKVSGGVITTVADSNGIAGYTGDQGSATDASLRSPGSLAVDSSGNLYINDGGNLVVRKVSQGVISTFAGNGTNYSPDGVKAIDAQLTPTFISLGGAQDDLYIVDSKSVRKVSGGVITTIYTGNPLSVAADRAGNVYVSDSWDELNDAGYTILHRNIFQIASGVTTTALAGRAGYLAVDASGTLYVADGNVFTLSGGVITTVAGNGTSGYSGDGGPATSAGLNAAGVAVDASGDIYILDGGYCSYPSDCRVRKVSNGIITSVALSLSEPSGIGGIAADAFGNLYVSDTGTHTVLRFLGGVTATVAGDGSAAGYSGDGVPATSVPLEPGGIAVDSVGNLYIIDSNFRVRRVDHLVGSTPITVTTSPAGLRIVVDGATYTSPQTFYFNTSESHTISAPSPQGTNTVFVSWSDGGAQTHVITVPSVGTTYTATFNVPQYSLTTSVSPPGGGIISVNPPTATGGYNDSTSVQLTATANPGYLFASWSGDLSGSTNPQSLKMSGPRNVQANFIANPNPSPIAVGSQPASGTGTAQTFTFQFSHPSGWQSLSVVNVLVNNFLDGHRACYLAYVLSSNALVLVDDTGDAGGPYAGSLVLGSSGTIQNSQCAVSLVSAMGSGTTLSLTLSLTFQPGFGGNRIFYLAARDTAQNNSAWQAFGVWQVPFTPSGTISVGSLSLARGSSSSGTPQSFALTLTDVKGAGDIGIVNLLVNNFIDGRQACYLAYVASSNTLLLVDDAGDAGGPFAGRMVLNGAGGPIQNSQCVIGALSSAVLSGNTLTLTLNITFTANLTGNQVLYIAGRDAAGGNNTDWQAMGTWTVQ
ncbi:hypothetical protein SBA4_860023 [Candidatus Sulfopaludibacter sp. SbA4]|nr:hypothetical protein SBA4_860023 [Candidatus Sulfopaludibacter sp. SbA4]